MTDLEVLERANHMAAESLCPEMFEQWEAVRNALMTTRKSLQPEEIRSLTKPGFHLVFLGNSDGRARHYPNGFVACLDGTYSGDIGRRDVVRTIPTCFTVWEWVTDRWPMADELEAGK